MINEIFNELYNEDNYLFSCKRYFGIDRHISILNINDKIVRNEGYIISLNDDEKGQ